LKYDLQILQLMAEKTWFNIFHFHGKDIMTDLMPELPVNCISWHDRRTFPSLSEARKLFPDKCLVGGINEKKTIMDGTLQEITEEVYGAIEQTGGRKLIVAPGCVAPTRTPHMNYYAARMAVETYRTGIEVDFIA
ncbi:MAG: uroporphyrinogen decarboxylase family protein, partial [Halanaerobiales bacterium]